MYRYCSRDAIHLLWNAAEKAAEAAPEPTQNAPPREPELRSQSAAPPPRVRCATAIVLSFKRSFVAGGCRAHRQISTHIPARTESQAAVGRPCFLRKPVAVRTRRSAAEKRDTQARVLLSRVFACVAMLVVCGGGALRMDYQRDLPALPQAGGRVFGRQMLFYATGPLSAHREWRK